ncbi:MAG: PorP/SprF family type IX secretion system membrane protein [Bacteroidota bacterium]
MHRSKYILLLALTIFIGANIQAQSPPVYSQIYFNPFLYNPSFAGNGSGSELFLTHRRQWVGLNDAPVVSAFSFHHATKGNIGLAFDVQSEETVLLRTSNAAATFAYKVPLGEQHYVKFGLSAGIGWNDFDIGAFGNTNDPSVGGDPAILNASENNLFLDGRFGVHYRNKNLVLGFSLPKLFESRVNNPDMFNEISIQRLEEKIAFASYKFELTPGQLYLEPFVLYRTGVEFNEQIEWSALVHYKDFVTVGGTYRKEHGAAVLFGIKPLDFLEAGYSYELAPFNNDNLSFSSHEIQLKIRFKRKEKPYIVEESDNSVGEPITQVEETQEDEVEETEAEEKEEVTSPERKTTNNRNQSEPDEQQQQKEEVEEEVKPIENTNEVIKEEDRSNESEIITEVKSEDVDAPDYQPGELIEPGHYVVVGAFRSLENAKKLSRDLSRAGFDNQIAFYPGNQYYNVYLHRAVQIDDARQTRDKFRKVNMMSLPNAWVMSVE